MMSEDGFREAAKQKMTRAFKVFVKRFRDHLAASVASSDAPIDYHTILENAPRLFVVAYGGHGQAFEPVSREQLNESIRVGDGESCFAMAHMYDLVESNLKVLSKNIQPEMVENYLIIHHDGRQPVAI